MADTTVGLPVQTRTGEFVRAKGIDTGGTNEWAISAAGRLSVDASGVAVPITDNAGSLTVDAPVGTPVFVRLSDGAATLIGQKVMASSLPVTIASDQSGYYVGDAAATATPTGLMAEALANAAAPTDVSANNDAVAIWALRNGSQVVNLASGGTLITIGQKAMASSVPVVIASDQSAVAVDSELPAAAALADATANPTVPGVGAFLMGYNGTTFDRVRTANTGRLQVDVITGAGGTQYVGDAAATATPTGTMSMALANAAAPSDVSANNDAVALWALRNGSLVVNLASAGTLITLGQKAMASSLPVTIASDQATFPITMATQYVGDAAATATPTGNMVMALANAAAPSDVSANNDAVALWALRNGSLVTNLASGGTLITLGQKVMASSLPVVLASDQSAVAENLTQIGGATQSQTNPLFVRLTDGTTAYTASSGAPVSPQFSTVTSAALGAGAAVDLNNTVITNGKTGQLMGIDVGSTVPLKVEIKTVNSSNTATTRIVLFCPPFTNLQWRSPAKTFITQAGAATNACFRVTVTNKDLNQAADVYETGYWDEV